MGVPIIPFLYVLHHILGTNVAYRKPANQSTTVRGGNPLNANDGKKSLAHSYKKCSETQKEVSPWWKVDLLKPYPVHVVRVTTRGCCGHSPLQDLEIRVGNSSTNLQGNPLCTWFPGTIGKFQCNKDPDPMIIFVDYNS